MVPERLITADCHIAPPYELINELPEHYREFFPRIEKDENGKDVFKAGHIVTMAMMTGEGTASDITADATGAVGNVVAEAHPSFDAAGLKHPLMAAARCVPNDVAIGGRTRLWIVSGSNMSGKSTLLRAIGLNTVLAWAGAPVAASRLALSRLRTGASPGAVPAGRDPERNKLARPENRCCRDRSRAPRSWRHRTDHHP